MPNAAKQERIEKRANDGLVRGEKDRLFDLNKNDLIKLNGIAKKYLDEKNNAEFKRQFGLYLQSVSKSTKDKKTNSGNESDGKNLVMAVTCLSSIKKI
jgi:hypothetical protein